MTRSSISSNPLSLASDAPTPAAAPAQCPALVQATPITYSAQAALPFSDLPPAEQQLLQEIALERVYQLGEGAERFEAAQHSGQLVQASVAYALEAQSAIVGSAPITSFQDIHPYPETAQIYGPRENLIKAAALLIAQIKHSDEAALRQQRSSAGPMDLQQD